MPDGFTSPKRTLATGGPNEETIRKTIEAGANAITYTPPTNGDTMSSLMDKYRSL